MKKEKRIEYKIWIRKLLSASPPPLILPRRISWNLTRRLLQRRKRGTYQNLVSKVPLQVQFQVLKNCFKYQDFVRLISE